ncbi:MAG: DUF2807 domain-containing protein [Saprospiraceae bacterium]
MRNQFVKLTAFIVLLLVTISVSAQVKGNGKIITKTIEIDDFEKFDLNFVANVVITCQEETSFEITVDENILPYIGINSEDGQLKITQDKWIQPSEKVQIKIGVQNLNRIATSGYSKVTVKNLDSKDISVMPLVGTVVLEGSAATFRPGTEVGTIDATALKTNKVYANVWSRGKLKFDTAEYLEVIVAENGEVVYNTTPTKVNKKIKSKGAIYSKTEKKTIETETVKLVYVKFKLKNNTNQRRQFYVRGPNGKKGKKFSYGFPIGAQQKRAEDWPVGTKVYHVSKAGTRSLVYEVNASDEGKVIALF